MKQTLSVCAAAIAVCLTLPIASPAASAAPNAPQMAPLQYLLGTWHCIWKAGTQTGAEDQVFKTALGGAWLEEKELVTDSAGRSVVQTIHYTGYDREKHAYIHLGPDLSGSYELAQSADSNAWHYPGQTGAFIHTKVSDTERTIVETDRVNGNTAKVSMTCTKAP